MASSVSSERAFSSAGITISKRRNRLKKDVVEAIQCLKCMYKNDLIFRKAETIVDEEKEMDEDYELAMDNEGVKSDLDEQFSWDQIITDLDVDE
jgi:hAT family C-terminal dimerisation region